MGKRPFVFTAHDLEKMPDDGQRREIIAGDLFVAPSPSVEHQRLSVRLLVLLNSYAEHTGGEVFAAPLDVYFTSTDVVEPDLIVIAADRSDIVGEKRINGAPSLVVEILSPSTSETDREEKMRLYARHGVPEYWIVDPKAKTIEVYSTPSGDVYAESRRDAAPQTLVSATLADLRVDLAALFR